MVRVPHVSSLTVIIAIFIVVALAAAGCTPPVEEAFEEPTASSTTGQAPSSSDPPEQDPPATEGDDSMPFTSLSQAPEEMRTILAELDGKLAIGGDNTVAVTRPDGQGYIEVEGDRSRLNGQPTWSNDGGELIWASASSVSQEARIQGFDDEGVAAGDPARVSVPGPPVFYFQWSFDDARILTLRNAPGAQAAVEAGVIDVDEESAGSLATARPFFVSWAPNEAQVAAHIDDRRVVSYGPPLRPNDDQEAVASPIVDGGGFSAPVWLDDDTLLVVTDGQLSSVAVDNGEVTPLIDLTQPIRFVVSPDRSKVAFQGAAALADQPIEAGLATRRVQTAEPLVILDIATRQTVTVTEAPAIAWEWSPDSTRLAWLAFDGSVARRLARWQFWSSDGHLAANETAPTLRLGDKELVNYLPFFDQYAQSMTRWSPDSSAFALAGSSGAADGIWVHLIDHAFPAVLVAPGDIVAWGPGPTPPESAGRSPA